MLTLYITNSPIRPMLSSSYRIPKEEIPNIVRRGKKFSSEFFDVKAWFDDNLEHSHFAVVISAKVDKRAVVRNTIRRKFKAAIYKIINDELEIINKGTFRKGNYIFLIRNAKLQDLKSQEIEGLIKITLS